MRGLVGWSCLVIGLVGGIAGALAQPPNETPPKLNISDEFPDLAAPGVGPAGLGALGEGETLSVQAVFRAADGGPTGVLVIDARIAPEWHLYSVTQPPGGPLRTKIEVVSQPALEVLGPFVPDRPPSKRRVPEYPGIDLEEHADRVVWTAPARLPAGVSAEGFQLKVKLSGLTCRDNDACLPVRALVAAPLRGFQTTAASPTPPAPAAPAGVSEPDRAATNPPSPAPAKAADAAPFAGRVGPYKGSLSHAQIAGYLSTGHVLPGQVVTLTLTGTPDGEWHFYETAERDLKDGSPYKRTLVALDLPAGWKRGAVEADKPVTEKRTEGGTRAVFYEGAVTWTVPLQVPRDATAGPVTIRGILGYQTCDAASCDRPSGVEFRATIEVGEGAGQSADRVPLAFLASTYNHAAKLAEGAPGATAEVETTQRGTPSPATTAASQPGGDIPSEAAGTRKWDDVEVITGDDKNTTLGTVLMLAVAGGFLLNFMPCVLPVIGLKIMAFVHQAHGNRRQVFLLNLYYFLGLIAVFMVLATLAALFQFGWGKQFQSTGFNIALAAVVFVFALSMLGVWEIPLPGFVGSGAAANAAENEGPLGAFLKGALTTVLATPCTGPFMGTALTWAAKQPAPVIYLTFLALGLGMGLPYLAIGAFPQLLRFLPKPGVWMETFKQIMGFVLLGTVVFIYTFLQKDYLVATTGLLVGLGIACWWIGRTPVYAETAQKLAAWGIATVIAAVVGGSSLVFLGPSTAVLPWRPFSRVEIEQLVDSGNTVLVDFTAEWCLTCKVNEATALNTRKTLSLVESQKVVVVKADKTQGDATSDAIDQLLIDLGHTSTSIPFLVIFPGDGSRPLAFSGPVTQRMVSQALHRAGPSRAADPAGRLARGGE